jgi:hypothetical protein
MIRNNRSDVISYHFDDCVLDTFGEVLSLST